MGKGLTSSVVAGWSEEDQSLLLHGSRYSNSEVSHEHGQVYNPHVGMDTHNETISIAYGVAGRAEPPEYVGVILNRLRRPTP